MNKVHSSSFIVHRKTHHSSLITHHSKVKRGFTLVELLVYMALLAVFLIVLTDIFVSILDVQTESQATSAVEQDGRFTLSRLAYDIPRAETIVIPANLGESNSSLEIVDINGETHTYRVNSGNLQLTDNSGAHNLNGSETAVSAINFHRIGNVGGKDTIRIQFTVRSTTQRDAGPEIKNFTTTIGTR